MRYYWPSTKVKMAEYWPSFLFASLWAEMKSRSIKMLKRLCGQYPVILTKPAWSIKDLLYGIKNTLKKWSLYLLFFFFFEHWKGSQLFAKVMAWFGFLIFLLSSWQRNHRKFFYCQGKYNYCKWKIFKHPLRPRQNIITGIKQAIPSGQ